MHRLIKWFIPVIIMLLSDSIHAETPDTAAENIVWEEYVVHNWAVFVDSDLIAADSTIISRALGILSKELKDIQFVIPPAALEVLQQTRIYFVKPPSESHFGVYYPLRGDTALPQKYHKYRWFRRSGSIEVIPGRYIESYVLNKCWLLMHELAHAYHDRMRRQIDRKIKKAYDLAVMRKIYLNTRSDDMRYSTHGYALKNHHEYFAELSTAYFGRINYFPFDRFDLKGYDPLGYKMIREAWGVED